MTVIMVQANKVNPKGNSRSKILARGANSKNYDPYSGQWDDEISFYGLDNRFLQSCMVNDCHL